MAVTSSEVFGTVGGAGLELKVMNHLREILVSKEGRIETYQLQKEASGKAGTPLNSLCGGILTVAMEVIEPMPHILLAGGGHCAQAIVVPIQVAMVVLTLSTIATLRYSSSLVPPSLLV